jgi:phosphatidylserine/phosphatidylglycerophosphate/cardiolipin synthase-like enzyme
VGAHLRPRRLDRDAGAVVTEFVSGNRITLLRSGMEYFPALAAEFDAAQREIHLETYIYEDDVAGRAIAAALARAAQRGVATYVLVDGFGSKDLDPELIEGLRAAGVRFLVYRPNISPWTFRRSRLRRMHRKVAVIDARVAFVGGINIIDDMDTPKHTPPRFDYAVRIDGPLVARIHPAVKWLWALVTATQFKSARPRFRDLGPFTDIPCRHQGCALGDHHRVCLLFPRAEFPARIDGGRRTRRACRSAASGACGIRAAALRFPRAVRGLSGCWD